MTKDLFSGMPDELQELLGEVDKDFSTIEIKVEKRKYGKFWAIVSGLDVDSQKLKIILKNIKNRMACGGTVKEKNIEILFGRHDRSKDLIENLVKEGFKEEAIHVTSK